MANVLGYVKDLLESKVISLSLWQCTAFDNLRWVLRGRNFNIINLFFISKLLLLNQGGVITYV